MEYLLNKGTKESAPPLPSARSQPCPAPSPLSSSCFGSEMNVLSWLQWYGATSAPLEALTQGLRGEGRC